MNAFAVRLFARFLCLSGLAGYGTALALAATEAPAPTSPSPVKISADVRLRYEHTSENREADEDALGAALRLGLSSHLATSWQWMLEADRAFVVASNNDYNQLHGAVLTTPTAPGNETTNASFQEVSRVNSTIYFRQSVEEPADWRLSQAWLSFSRENTLVTLGRQRLAFDNERFIGADDWRLAPRVFDALAVRHSAGDHLQLNYAYVWNVNGPSRAPFFGNGWGLPSSGAIHHDSVKSHLLNISYTGCPVGTLTGYAYLLDFGGGRQASATYGVSFAGRQPLEDSMHFDYRAEAALQTDSDYNSHKFPTNYLAVEARLAWPQCSLTLGGERLSCDGPYAFSMPWSSQHRFNGWTDAIASLQDGCGLRDLYFEFAADLPLKAKLLAGYHDFQSLRQWYIEPNVFGTVHMGLGRANETDLQLTRSFGGFVNAAIKFADVRHLIYRGNVRRLWLQTEFSY